MNSLRPPRVARFARLRRGLALLASLGLGAGLSAGQGATRPPFLPPGFGDEVPSEQTGTPLDNLELRGIMVYENGRTVITIFDPSQSKSFSAELNETVNGMRVTGYEPDPGSVTVEAGGKSRRITVTKPTIVALAPQPARPPAQPAAGNVVPALSLAGPPPPGGVAGSPDEEVRLRMQRVAEEIRRRRAMRREQILSAQGQPGVQPPDPDQPPPPQ